MIESSFEIIEAINIDDIMSEFSFEMIELRNIDGIMYNDPESESNLDKEKDDPKTKNTIIEFNQSTCFSVKKAATTSGLARCVCSWKNCRKFQKAYKEYGHPVLDGVIKIKFIRGDSSSQPLKKSIDRTLKVSKDKKLNWEPGKRGEEVITYKIARHHFTEQHILRYLNDPKSYKWTELFTIAEAKKFLFKLEHKVSIRHSDADADLNYFQSPNVSEEYVKNHVRRMKQGDGGCDDIETYEVKKQVMVDPYGLKITYAGFLAKATGMPHGKGRIEYADGKWYEGDWKHGKWTGHGRVSNGDGDLYEGELRDDFKHGEGTMRFADGRVFVGEYINGQMIEGTMTYQDGSTYEGSWVDGMRHGRGKCVFNENGVYEGDFREGECHGYGKMTWNDGGWYEGEWWNGDMQGQGKEVRPDGSLRHDGEWSKNQPIRNRN